MCCQLSKDMLEGFIDRIKSYPIQFIFIEKGELKLNPEFEVWVATDQLLFDWLLNTMSLEVSSKMTHVSTAASLWNAAHQLASAQNKVMF